MNINLKDNTTPLRISIGGSGGGGGVSQEYVDMQDAATLESAIAAIPSKASQLENDAGYLTEHQSLDAYAKKTDIPNIDGKQDKLIAGDNITINNNKISSHDTVYDDTEIKEQIAAKQDELIAGNNITINGNVISAAGGGGASYDDTAIKKLIADNTTAIDKNAAAIDGKAAAGVSYTKTESDAKYLTEHQSLSGYATNTYVDTKASEVLSDATAYADAKVADIHIPNKTSELTNDAGFQTASDVDADVAAYVTAHKSELKGDKGDKGDTGAAGESIKGDKGDKGDAGVSPVRGVDYWNASDIATIKAYVDDAILGGAW